MNEVREADEPRSVCARFELLRVLVEAAQQFRVCGEQRVSEGFEGDEPVEVLEMAAQMFQRQDFKGGRRNVGEIRGRNPEVHDAGEERRVGFDETRRDIVQ
jgi:hypothetical protein